MTQLIQELADSSRRAILIELMGGSRTVTELVRATHLKQPNVSNHLAKLRDRGILRSQKTGRQVLYSLANGQVESVLQAYLAQRAPRAVSVGDLPGLRAAYLEAALDGNEEACAQFVQGALQQGRSMLDVYADLLGPAMFKVGDLYTSGQIDEADEHTASRITEAMMALVRQFVGRPATGERRALLGCVAGNDHTIGLAMINDVLRAAGWQTVLLGANVPTPAFVRATTSHEPDLLLVSLSTHDQLPETLELLHRIAPLRDRMRIGVGGLVAAAEARTLEAAGADFVTSSIREFAEQMLPRLTVQAANG